MLKLINRNSKSNNNNIYNHLNLKMLPYKTCSESDLEAPPLWSAQTQTQIARLRITFLFQLTK